MTLIEQIRKKYTGPELQSALAAYAFLHQLTKR